VLDIGSGDGSFAARLATRCWGVVAVDVEPSQVASAEQACEQYSNVTVRCGDFLSIDFEGERFDALTALASLHHMPIESAVTKMKSLLQPGGCLIVLGVWTDDDSIRDRAINILAVAFNRLCRLLYGPDAMT